MYGGVLELVLLLIIKDHAVVVHEVEDAGFPEGTAQELDEEVVLPFLRERRRYVLGLLLRAGLGRGRRLLLLATEEPL